MTGEQILRTMFSFLPFVVCLFWSICYLVQIRKNDTPKRYMTAFLVTCVVLYLCHALFFTVGLPYPLECVWTFASLSVYPIFYGYLCRLTSSDYTLRKLLPWLVPGAIVALAKYLMPDYEIDKLRLTLFAVQILCVCYFGMRKLNDFDKKLQAVYADTEGRDTTAVHHLLGAILLVSILSGLANTIGKGYFGTSIVLLETISTAFSSMLFALSYICFCRNFTIDQLNEEVMEEAIAETGCDETDTIAEDAHEDTEMIGQKIETLMVEQHYFLKHDLKISDIVMEIGSNRTYVSNYINSTYHCSFSDYMNNLRIEHAKNLMLSAQKGTKLSQIAEDSGYASEQSFYRNFRKFVGMTPAEWQASNQQ